MGDLFGMVLTGRHSKNILVTGGNSLFTNLTHRIENEIRAIRPFGSTIRCVQAKDPLLDAWRGASMWASSKDGGFEKSIVTKRMYEEFGHEYLVEHGMSNKW